MLIDYPAFVVRACARPDPGAIRAAPGYRSTGSGWAGHNYSAYMSGWLGWTRDYRASLHANSTDLC